MTRRRVRSVVVMSAIFTSMSIEELDNLGIRDECPKPTSRWDDTPSACPHTIGGRCVLLT